MSRAGHPYIYLPVAAWLLLSAFAGPSSARGADQTWERKLDPFLRRVALGVERRQGPLVDRLPARSRATFNTLPPFVLAERDAADPILYVRARLDDGMTESAESPLAMPGRSVGARRRVSEGLAARFDALGVEVRGRAGAIASLAVRASALESLAAIGEVKWLRAARAYRLQNDVGTSDAHTAARTENTTFGNAGAGVIVAVIDSGIDWTSPDFRNPDGTTRLLGIWDQTLASGVFPPPPGFGFGSYYSRADIDAALSGGPALATQDGFGHGTHVAGTAAGNGRATGNGVPEGTFAGMAPAADLLVVRVFHNDGTYCGACDLVAAVEFIDGVAQTEGKPWVGNMSLGSDLGGAHDGTSPDELAIDAVVRPGRPGTQMAIAAGNFGRSDRHFHWQGNLPAVGNTALTTFTLNSLTPNAGNNTDHIWLELWYRGSDSATVTVQTPGAQTVSAAAGADSGIVCTTSGAVHVDATNSDDAENGDNQVFITISDSGACAPVVEPATGLWTVRVTTNALGGAPGGPFDLWNAADTPRSQAGFGAGWVQLSAFNLAKSVSIPGTARHALTAGAYVSKTSWVNGDGGTTTPTGTNPLGSLASFSSIGPTRDGRTKPDFAAPGQWVGSTKSKDINAAGFQMERDQVHVGFYSGTSMATPHVAGAAALLLSLHPEFDAAQVRVALQRTARADLLTGGVPNNRFGWGKLRILEAAYDAAAMAAELGAGPDGQSFAWPGDDTTLSWNVYRGSLPGISASSYGSCFRSGLPSPAFTDTDLPPEGEGFFYFVTGVYLHPTSGLPVEGSLGTDSSGHLRPNSAACP